LVHPQTITYKNVFEKIGDTGGRVGANLFLFLAQDMEQSIKSSGDDIVVKIKGLLFGEGNN
jgi:hypothetical protein